jgi:hypothetical protein
MAFALLPVLTSRSFQRRPVISRLQGTTNSNNGHCYTEVPAG